MPQPKHFYSARSLFLILFLFSLISRDVQGEKYVTAIAQKSQGIYSLLKRYHLPATNRYKAIFREINAAKFRTHDGLLQNHSYKMPVVIYHFNGRTIRSSIGINDYARAKRIERYNQKVYQAGLQRLPYRVGKELWVPYYEIKHAPSSTNKSIFFGARYQQIDIIDHKLKGNVYYLVSGHGGPDPGAIGRRGKNLLSEDEYAYDITLRLARRLLQHQATVYMIVHDPNDGIRDSRILKSDKDERYYGNGKIPEDRRQRLKQRAQIINRLYRRHLNTARRQEVVVIHCDSRSTRKRIDIFFYYAPGSRSGKRLAYDLLRKIKSRYQLKQPNRQYHGVVKSRRLYMLKETRPPAVYIELANIRNSFDQRRLILKDNRQAVANWLCLGLIDAR